jgi:hypothetical protein
MRQKLHRVPSGYDHYSVSSKGARIAKVVLRSGAIRKREKFWREMAYQALRKYLGSCIGRNRKPFRTSVVLLSRQRAVVDAEALQA